MIATGTLADDVARLRAKAASGALCIDFDGTLAPIVDHPEHARALDGTSDLLARLARTWAAVALISGRPAAFLAERAPAANVRYVGLYGLQEMRNGELEVDEQLRAARSRVADATDALRNDDVVRASGAYVEDKTYAVGVHLRRVEDAQRWIPATVELADRLAREFELEIVVGKLVWELRPRARGDKGDAVRRVVEECDARALVVIGDDLGDLPAFAMGATLRERGLDVVRIAVRSGETPDAVLAAVDRVVDGPHAVLDFLTSLA